MTSINALETPAMIIDTAGPAIVEANILARRLWGLADSTELPVSLDPAMPALAKMQASVSSNDAARCQGIRPQNDERTAPLVWWTSLGAQRLSGQITPMDMPGTFLVIFKDTCDRASEPGSRSQAIHDEDIDDALISPTPIKTEAVTTAQESATIDSPNRIDMQAMAHELRTPVGAIIALAEMIETEQFGPLGDPRYQEYARDIGDSARLSLSIVATALEQDAASGNPLLSSFSELNVAELIHKCQRTVRQSALEAKVELKQAIDADLPNLIASAHGLTQILLNLLSNAIKFTPAGGTVTIEAATTSEGQLSISVSDTGVGMTGIDASVLIAEADGKSGNATEHVPTSTRASTAPRGIGFSLVRRLARAMSAEFVVASTRGVGTRVTLSFPSEKLIPVAAAHKEV